MSTAKTKPFGLPVAMAPYLAGRNSPPSPEQASLIEIAEAMPAGGMRLGTEAGTMLSILASCLQPRFALEVGTFIGYSSLCIASGLADGGRLLCCDVSDEWTAIARDHWDRAGVSDRIDLVLAPAIETLGELAKRPEGPPTIDLAFVDADKASYVDYYEAIVPMLSETGLLAVDNTMWAGRVLDEEDSSVDTVALRRFNDHVAADERTTNVTVPIGDGITLITPR